MNGLRRLQENTRQQVYGNFRLCMDDVLLTRVLHDDITLLILVVSERQEDNITLIDPDLLPQFAANMCKTTSAVETLGFQTSVSEHLDDLGVFLAFLLEDEFALFIVVLVLTPTSVLASLYYVLVCAVAEF